MLSHDPAQVARWRALRAQIAAAAPAERDHLLAARALATRRRVVTVIAHAGSGHIGGDLSVADILTALYFSVLEVDPADPTAPGRDRLILSKGHSAVALYTTLAACGYFEDAELETFMAPLSALNGHPSRTYVPGVETSTGPLGHGLPVAVGCALGSRLTGYGNRVVVVVGDGELQEGSNWEALMCAAHQGLANLTAVVDRNRLQQGDRTEATNRLEPLADKLAAFGWEVREADGHRFTDLLPALAPSRTGQPVAVIAHTVKGKGVSAFEDGVAWHHKVPDAAQVAKALEELA
jgi:transketolase